MRLLTDPIGFNCLIMALYVAASIAHFTGRNIGQGCYWLFAFGITFTVTFLMEGK